MLSTGWAAPPDVSTDAWRLFLRAERCAIALSTRGEGDAPPVLHATATVELQHILSARAQILELGRLAARAGLRVAVLKGGLLALGPGGGVDLDDVDVLAEPGREGAIGALLDDTGYRAVAVDNSTHLGGRLVPSAVPVEVHRNIRELGSAEALWRSACPVEGTPGVWRLGPSEHAQHVLFHSVRTHPDRRAVLRDLLVIGEADRALTDAQRAELDRVVAAGEGSAMLRRTLDMARNLHSDPLVVDAAARYLLLTPIPCWLDGKLGGQMGRRVFSQLADRESRRGYWRGTWRGAEQSPWGTLRSVEEVVPGLGRWIRRALRLVRAPAVVLAAVPLVNRARRLGRRGASQSAPSAGANPATRRSESP